MRADPRAAQWTGQLAWLGLVLLAVAAWRAWPRASEDASPAAALRAVVFDASASTTRRRPGWNLWARKQLREEALAAQAADEELMVVVYGAEVRRLRGGPAPAEWLQQLAGRGGRTLELSLDMRGARGSELDAALAIVEDELLAPGRLAASLVLLAEPEFSGPDPTPRLARLERGGVQVDWRRPPAASTLDFALLDLEVPESPVAGEPAAVRVELALAPGTERARHLELEVSYESREATREFTVAIEAPAGVLEPDGYLHFMRSIDLGPLPEGRSTVSLRARGRAAQASASSTDSIPENDSLSASLHAGDARLVALVARPERQAAARAWIGSDPARWPGLQWLVMGPEELLRVAGELDLVVSFDLAADELPRAELLGLLERGGGWLHCGGWGSSRDYPGPGAMRDATSLAELLPLVGVRDDAPPRDIVLLVDGSGSMVGEPFEYVRRALADLVRIAPPGDELRLRFFTGTVSSVQVLDTSPAASSETLRTIEELHVPGGPTAILYSLEQLVPLRAERERPSLVLMLSDGRDVNAFNSAERGAAIRAAFAAQGADLRALAMGDEARIDFLAQLFGGAEFVIDASDLTRLGELFQHEIFSESVREGALAVELSAPGEAAVGADLARSWRAADLKLPNASRYLRTRTRPGATPLWINVEHGEPLLAIQRVSGGLVAAWPSAPLGEWSPKYARADDCLGPLLRYLAAGRRRGDRPRLTATPEQLLLAAVPRDWPTRVEARFRAVLSEGDPPLLGELEGGRAIFDLGPAAPGLDPRDARHAPRPAFLDDLPAGGPLSLAFSPAKGPLSGPSSEPAEAIALVGFSVPTAAEFLPRGRRLAPAPWTASGAPTATRSPLRVDPWAWCYGLAGALMLFVAALGQGARGGRM